MTKVLVVATSRKTRGGITSVVKAHETGEQWKRFHCRWIETHRDGNVVRKLWYLFTAIIEYICLLPFYDIVHIHLAAVERKIPFVFFAKCFKKKIILHFHFPDPNTTIYDSHKSSRYGWCIKQADIVIVLSNTWKKMLKDKYNADNLRVVYNPCPQVNRGDEDKKKIILYVGNLSERKGYKDLLKAFAEMKEIAKDWRLVFAGNGEIEMGENMAKELGIGNQCDFLGWISGEKKALSFQKAMIYCLPSYAEGFPMGVLDAWAYGLPVITTPVGGLPDILEDNKNSMSFSPGDIDSLATCLRNMIVNEKLRNNIAKESVKLADDIFNIEKINKQIGALYEECE